MPSPEYNARDSHPSLEGKVILVTGGSSGLGEQCVLAFAQRRPAMIWLAARNLSNIQATITKTREDVPDAAIRPLQIDLNSFDSIKRAASVVLSDSDRLDLLILNAGAMGLPPGVSQEGYEVHFGANCLGHALLTKLLIPRLNETAERREVGDRKPDVRVILVGSDAVYRSPNNTIHFDRLKSDCKEMGTIGRYGQAKLATALFGRALARQSPLLKVAVVHPGVGATNLARSMVEAYPIIRPLVYLSSFLIQSPESGVRNHLWAALSPEIVSGEYYTPVGQIGHVTSEVRNDDLADKLWYWMEGEFPQHGF
ncbi:unnamed protein product [Clonostachys rosea]|uniref:Uncharacterized protein n=1 Tax=Bionectria ochroleuca TaxID=29856 RepID=A0ABY6U1E3_BIOOC|nr:unnamed protein product [Clonostachys rosea]